MKGRRKGFFCQPGFNKRQKFDFVWLKVFFFCEVDHLCWFLKFLEDFVQKRFNFDHDRSIHIFFEPPSAMINLTKSIPIPNTFKSFPFSRNSNRNSSNSITFSIHFLFYPNPNCWWLFKELQRFVLWKFFSCIINAA